jgi:selenocysteine lyase/cysteine desulfurase
LTILSDTRRLFGRSLAADPDRLHMAAHSHHLWPDASFDGQVECWNDAARLADRKWDRIMGEVWPQAQAFVAAELGTAMPEAVLFAPNTHDLLVRLFMAVPAPAPVRVLTSDGEFHSARRQFARWEESGAAVVERVPVEPFGSFAQRFTEKAGAGRHDLVFVSHLLFGSGRSFDALDQVAALAGPGGPWVVIDGYHAFMAVASPLPKALASSLFYLGGGYKYAMAGEGCGFMHAPPGFGDRPPITGWFAEFEDLTLAPGMVGYAADWRRFMGATFDPSGLYRFNAVQRMLQSQRLTTLRISHHVHALQLRLIGNLAGSPLGEAELLNPPDPEKPGARFLAFRDPRAAGWSQALASRNCITDVRGDVLRVGLGLYHGPEDVDRFAELARSLA